MPRRYTLTQRFEKRYANCRTEEAKRKCLFDFRNELKQAIDAIGYFALEEKAPNLSEMEVLTLLEPLVKRLWNQGVGGKNKELHFKSKLVINTKVFGAASVMLILLLNYVGAQMQNPYAKQLYVAHERPLADILRSYYYDVLKRPLKIPA